MPTELRPGYHEQLNDIQTGIARMSAGVTELVPRVTDILLEGDLESAEYVILGDVAYDQKSLDDAYDQSVYAPNRAQILARFASTS